MWRGIAGLQMAAGRLWCAVAVLLFVAGMIPEVSASQPMYEDQAGLHDWHRENLGIVNRVQIAGQHSVLSAEGGVLAAVPNVPAAGGRLAWRVVMSEPDDLGAWAALDSGSVFVVSRDGTRAKAFAVESGSMMWETTLAISGTASEAQPAVQCTAAPSLRALPGDLPAASDAVVVLTCNGLLVVHASDGAVAGSVPMSGLAAGMDRAEVTALQIGDVENGAVRLLVAGPWGAALANVEVATARVAGARVLSAEEGGVKLDTSLSSIALSGSDVLALSEDGMQVWSLLSSNATTLDDLSDQRLSTCTSPEVRGLGEGLFSLQCAMAEGYIAFVVRTSTNETRSWQPVKDNLELAELELERQTRLASLSKLERKVEDVKSGLMSFADLPSKLRAKSAAAREAAKRWPEALHSVSRGLFSDAFRFGDRVFVTIVDVGPANGGSFASTVIETNAGRVMAGESVDGPEAGACWAAPLSFRQARPDRKVVFDQDPEKFEKMTAEEKKSIVRREMEKERLYRESQRKLLYTCADAVRAVATVVREAEGNQIALSYVAVLDDGTVSAYHGRRFSPRAYGANVQLGNVMTVWTRPDFLGAANVAAVADLPPKMSFFFVDSRTAKPLKPAERFAMAVASAKVTAGLGTPRDVQMLAALRSRASDAWLPTADERGMRRQLILGLSNGDVVSLHSGDGRILWRAVLHHQRCAVRDMGPAKESHSFEQSAQVWVLRDCEGGVSRLSFIDTFSGRVTETHTLTFVPEKVFTLRNMHRGSDYEIHGVVLLRPGDATASADTITAHVFPRHRGVLKSMREMVANGTLYTWLPSERGLTGYLLSGHVDGPKSGVYSATSVWHVATAGRPLAAVARDRTEPIYSGSRPSISGALSFKYTNPNTAVVVSNDDSVADGAAPGLLVQAVDTVTGRVLFSQQHAGATGPVQALFGEHWVVYHYWSTANGRSEVAVVDFVDGSKAAPRGLSGLLSALFGKQDAEPVSSLDGVPVRARSQTYFPPHHAVALAPTRTSMGVANKQVLMGTAAGQVYAFDRKLLDPRRPVLQSIGRSQADIKKEIAAVRQAGMLPYQEALPAPSMSCLTHKHRVAGLRGIVAAATQLESTSVVFVYGLDLFARRHLPAGQFDALADDFAVAAVVVSLLAMVILATVLVRVGKQKDLAKKWA
ncbi:unnamed protein product [Pedinophyceae sp. YPF-701]|nr:unnamed protein product [Pedinophyceae sp. YPF-701]